MSYLAGYFSISFEKITFYTEILTQKVELWIFFFTRFTLKQHHKTTFLSKNISVENIYGARRNRLLRAQKKTRARYLDDSSQMIDIV